MSVTVIAHFYNEEFLLPYWLRHHHSLFHHGIMIDYASTDRSQEIIREMAPTWEIRSSRNNMFDSRDIDAEVYDIEHEVNGWKVVLNITEFILHANLARYLKEFEAQYPDLLGVRCSGVVQVDRLEEQFLPLTEAPLWEQRTFGYIEPKRWNSLNPPSLRCRTIHKAPHGQYGPGRHVSSLPCHFDPNLFLFWVGWGLIEQKKKRNARTRSRIPERDLAIGWGSHHVWSDEEIEQFWRQEIAAAGELMDVPEYKEVVEKLHIPLLPGKEDY